MKTLLALGAGFAALTLTATAQPPTPDRVMVHVVGPRQAADADNDGWITRAEAGAAADTAFASLDSNNDNRLDAADQHALRDRVPGDCTVTETPEGRRVECNRIRVGGDGEHVHILPRGDNCTTEESGQADERRIVVRCEGGEGRRVQIVPGGDREVRILGADDDDCRREESNEGRERRITLICEDDGEDGDRRVEVRRAPGGDVIIHRDGGAWVEHPGVPPTPPIAAVPPIPPLPPLPMFIAHDGEADTNGDGSLSQAEFRAQHLRYFDASDVNGDGRIQAPPRPPEPPTPPSPPEPPRRR